LWTHLDHHPIFASSPRRRRKLRRAGAERYPARVLRALHLHGVGPAPRLDLALAPRLDVRAGDNGLGKSFGLDVAWWR
jgi:hypothetical protein